MTDHGIEPLNREFIARIYHYCYRRTNNSYDAEDLAQEIAVAVLRAWKSGERPANFNAWLWAVARNHWLKYLDWQQRIRTNMPYVEGGQVMAMQSVPEEGALELPEDYEEAAHALYLTVS